MAFNKVLSVLLVCGAVAISVADDWFDDIPNEDFGEQEERELAMELRSLREQRAKLFECNKLGESCRGVVPCCGSLQCYWKDGYSLKTQGECVQCVQSGQLCQRDKQCCSSLVCQKANAYYVDGRCDNPRPAGQECHEDDQCSSRNCRISYLNKIKGSGGVCA